MYMHQNQTDLQIHRVVSFIADLVHQSLKQKYCACNTSLLLSDLKMEDGRSHLSKILARNHGYFNITAMLTAELKVIWGIVTNSSTDIGISASAGKYPFPPPPPLLPELIGVNTCEILLKSSINTHKYHIS